MNKQFKIGIVGATGYTGVELLRLLANHPHIDVIAVTSRQEAGKAIADYFPSLRGFYDLVFQSPEQVDFSQCDLVFFATPHGVAMNEAPALLAQGIKIVDLSADYRIQDQATWEKWYGMPHSSPEWISKAVYGLCELNRSDIQNAQLIATPGCYPTAVSLPLLPLIQHNALIDNSPIIADCKSGVSGAGRKASIDSLFCEAGDNFKAYGITGHRHLPEIRQSIALFNPQMAKNFIFVPHLTPLIRGMHATIYVEAKDGICLHDILSQHHQNNTFVDIMPQGSHPETRSVKASNQCRISVQKAPDTEKNSWVILSVIDNLVKGAAGQAIQNMNLMLGLDENLGLSHAPILP
jgi:N-acetyl-gamma-glutamyl-phosphate reductase